MAKLFGETYRVVENPHEKDAAIEIIDGEWKDLVYQYGKVEFVEGKNHLNFERTIRRLPEGGNMDELLNNSELNNLMGDILVELMQEQIEREKENEFRETKRAD